MTELEDDTEYFYFNVHSQTPRRLTNNTFVAADSPIEYFTWLPVRADPSAPNGGFVVDVSEEHHPPPARLGDTNIYKDSSSPVPRIWVPTVRALPDTPPSATHTIIAAQISGFRGVLSQRPAININGDWYYSTTSHSWQFRHEGDVLRNVSFAELKRVAMQGAALFFGANDVFLSEVRNAAQAAQIIENAGHNPDGRNYYWVEGSTFNRLDVFTAAESNRLLPDYHVIDNAPVFGGSDDTIAGAVDAWHLTDIDHPTGVWGMVNFGDDAEYRRFKVADFDALVEMVADAAATDANGLPFRVGDGNTVWIAPTAGGKVAVGWSHADAMPSAVDLYFERL